MATPEDQIPKEGETTSTLDGADSNKGGTESEPTKQEPSVPTTPEPSTPLFQGTRIEGRTQEEGLAYIKLLEQTVNEQKDRITEGELEVTKPSPVVEPEEDLNFFDNPKEAIRREMERAIAPINEQIAAFRAQGVAQTAWTAIEQEIPDFPQYRHLVDQLVQAKGYSQADITVESLRQLYYTAVGWNERHGGTQVTSPTPTQGIPAAQHIPQHNPSTAPLPKEGLDKPKQRELTENERRLAAEWNMSHSEYLRLQDENLELEDYHADNSGD